MGIRKIQKLIILLVLASFTLGQIPGIFLQLLAGSPFRIHLLDILVAFLAISYFDGKKLRIVVPLATVSGLSLALSLFSGYFDPSGVLYLLRIAFYISLFFVLPKQDLLPHLLLVSLVVALYGWVQYFLFPNLVALKYFGWDDHYFRLVSTFLDPAFVAIIFVLGCLLSVYFYLKTSQKSYLLALLFLFVTLGFTYSRASFIALSVGLFVILWRKHKELLLILVSSFLVIIVLLPRNVGGEGVNLARTNSIFQKIENYKQGIEIFSKSPVFGVGYNNVCKAKARLGYPSAGNSCFGIDNSFLFLFTSIGVVGFIVLASIFIRLQSYMGSNMQGRLWIASLSSVFVHSLFTNTLFYPWVLIFMAILWAECSSTRSKKA